MVSFFIRFFLCIISFQINFTLLKTLGILCKILKNICKFSKLTAYYHFSLHIFFLTKKSTVHYVLCFIYIYIYKFVDKYRCNSLEKTCFLSNQSNQPYLLFIHYYINRYTSCGINNSLHVNMKTGNKQTT